MELANKKRLENHKKKLNGGNQKYKQPERMVSIKSGAIESLFSKFDN
jgi:hypothetical protein